MFENPVNQSLFYTQLATNPNYLLPNEAIDKIVERKTDYTFPDELKNHIQMVSYGYYNNGPNASVFGSYLYRLQKNPSDIDLIENIVYKGSEQEVINSFVKTFQKIIKKIMSDHLHYITDIKCGLDQRYIFNIGEMQEGKFTPAIDLMSNFKKLLDKKDITKANYEFIYDTIYKSKLDAIAYEKVLIFLRDRYIIRWTPQEVLKGHKILFNGKRINLNDACKMDTLIKLDVVVNISNKFTEITNIYNLAYEQNNIRHEINYNS